MICTRAGGWKMLYKGDLGIINILLNVYHHMDDDWDFVMVIEGDPGTGKSTFALNLLETWYKVILRKKITKEHINCIHQGYVPFLKHYKEMGAYDMNIYDESSKDLNSLDFMKKLSKDLVKLYDVFRCKRFFTVVILPKFFRLNKALREDRIRCVVEVPKRKTYKLWAKRGVTLANAFNQGRKMKRMGIIKPMHISCFPDYNGILRAAYKDQKEGGVDAVLDEVIGSAAQSTASMTLVDAYKTQVAELRDKGKTLPEIAKELRISVGTAHKCLTVAKATEA